MLHVDPHTVAAAPLEPQSTFDPIRYVAYMRECGIRMYAHRDERRGVDTLSWDISQAHNVDQDAVCLRHHGDARVNIEGDLRGERRVWEVLRAMEYIAAARECGLDVFPWRGVDQAHIACEFGRDEDSEEWSYGACSCRLLKRPEVGYHADLPNGLLHDVLCAELGIDPDDPDLCNKVRTIQAAEARS